jgi:hypothetical protein
LLRFFAPFFFASFFCFVFFCVSRFHMETRFGAPPAIPDRIKCTPPPCQCLEFLVKSCLSKVIYIGTTSIFGVFFECRVFCEVTPTRREARFENSQGLHAHLCTSGIAPQNESGGVAEGGAPLDSTLLRPLSGNTGIAAWRCDF